MSKSKEFKLLHNELIINLENINNIISKYLKKIKKDYKYIIIDQKYQLLTKIAQDENIDLNKLTSKYLTDKELNYITNNVHIYNTISPNTLLLDKIIINNVTYYYENKEDGKVYNVNSQHIGYYKNSKIEFIL